MKTVALHFWNSESKLQLKMDNYEIPMVNTTKFLGVYIDSFLTWEYHVNNVLHKVRNNKRLMSLGKHVLDKSSFKKVYLAHVHSHLNYGILVWGSMLSNGQLGELRKVQNNCISLIAKSKSMIAAINALMRSMNILSINQMVQFSLRKLGYKITHKLLPAPILNIFNADGGMKTYRYPTRNKHTPNILKHQSGIFNKSFLCQTIKLFSGTQESIKQEPTLGRFTSQLKKHFLTQT